MLWTRLRAAWLAPWVRFRARLWRRTWYKRWWLWRQVVLVPGRRRTRACAAAQAATRPAACLLYVRGSVHVYKERDGEKLACWLRDTTLAHAGCARERVLYDQGRELFLSARFARPEPLPRVAGDLLLTLGARCANKRLLRTR